MEIPWNTKVLTKQSCSEHHSCSVLRLFTFFDLERVYDYLCRLAETTINTVYQVTSIELRGSSVVQLGLCFIADV